MNKLATTNPHKPSTSSFRCKLTKESLNKTETNKPDLRQAILFLQGEKELVLAAVLSEQGVHDPLVLQKLVILCFQPVFYGRVSEWCCSTNGVRRGCPTWKNNSKVAWRFLRVTRPLMGLIAFWVWTLIGKRWNVTVYGRIWRIWLCFMVIIWKIQIWLIFIWGKIVVLAVNIMLF